MPTFREKFKAAHQARLAEAETFMALSLVDMAVELMPAFGPGGPANVVLRRGADREQLVSWLVKTQEVRPGFKQLSLLRTRVLEAVQLLEHAGLVYVHSITHGSNNGPSTRYWRATEAGMAALANGRDAVSQCISYGTGAASAPAVAPPDVAPPRPLSAQRLQELEALRATGAISDAEYTAKRQRIIDEL
jgi:hypothetical protein